MPRYHYDERNLSGEPTDFAEPADPIIVCQCGHDEDDHRGGLGSCEHVTEQFGPLGLHCECTAFHFYCTKCGLPHEGGAEHGHWGPRPLPAPADSDLIIAAERLVRHADWALGWLNALHAAVARDDVLVTTMPRDFGRPALCQAIADARRAIAAARGEGG